MAVEISYKAQYVDYVIGRAFIDANYNNKTNQIAFISSNGTHNVTLPLVSSSGAGLMSTQMYSEFSAFRLRMSELSTIPTSANCSYSTNGVDININRGSTTLFSTTLACATETTAGLMSPTDKAALKTITSSNVFAVPFDVHWNSDDNELRVTISSSINTSNLSAELVRYVKGKHGTEESARHQGYGRKRLRYGGWKIARDSHGKTVELSVSRNRNYELGIEYIIRVSKNNISPRPDTDMTFVSYAEFVNGLSADHKFGYCSVLKKCAIVLTLNGKVISPYLKFRVRKSKDGHFYMSRW